MSSANWYTASTEPEKLLVEGFVAAGRGKAAIRIAPMADAIGAALGRRPWPGSLNVVLRKPLLLNLQTRAFSQGQRHFWPIEIAGTPSLAYRWDSCPLHVIEIVSYLHLRSNLGLTDGKRVELRLGRNLITHIPLQNKIAWSLLWGANGALYYRSDRFTSWMQRIGPLWRMSTQQIQSFASGATGKQTE